MKEAIPYRSWSNMTVRPGLERPKSEEVIKAAEGGGSPETVKSLAEENAVLVVGRRGCCMCHVVKRLLQGLGANPLVYEVEEETEVAAAAAEGGSDAAALQFPAVFIGGKLVGGLEWLIGAHISGELVPVLKQAGALWL